MKRLIEIILGLVLINQHLQASKILDRAEEEKQIVNKHEN